MAATGLHQQSLSARLGSVERPGLAHSQETKTKTNETQRTKLMKKYRGCLYELILHPFASQKNQIEFRLKQKISGLFNSVNLEAAPGPNASSATIATIPFFDDATF